MSVWTMERRGRAREERLPCGRVKVRPNRHRPSGAANELDLELHAQSLPAIPDSRVESEVSVGLTRN